LVLTIECYYCK